MPRKNEPSERMCVVTRQSMPVDALIRFAVSPDGVVVPDLRRRLPGRGVWIRADRETVAVAVKKHHLERAFDGKVVVSATLVNDIDALLLASALSALSLARKAGDALAGFGKVETALASEGVLALVHASEAAEDGIAKLTMAARRNGGNAGIAVIRCFSGTELDLAFGRSNVVHAALLAGPAGANMLARVHDLLRYRGDEDHRDGGFGRFIDASTDVREPVRQDVRN